ncbi:reverse transcriptase domain-containing protein [Tanacetum coccineum]
MNLRLHRRNRRVSFERRDERPAQPIIVQLPILDINYIRHFLDILENYNLMDDEPMWAADRVVAPTPSSVITIPETANEFAIIAENMLVEVGKFTFPVDFVILEMEEDIKVPLILRRSFLHIVDAVIRVKQKQLNLGVGTERMTFSIDSAMKHSYSNDDTCFSIDVIDEILEEDFDALLDEGSEILCSIEGTILEEKLFAEFDEFMAMNIEENYESESEAEEPPFKKITFDTNYKIKTSLEEPSSNLELKLLPDHLEYVFLEESTFLPIIISSQLSEQNKNKLIFVLKRHKQAFA